MEIILLGAMFSMHMVYLHRSTGIGSALVFYYLMLSFSTFCSPLPWLTLNVSFLNSICSIKLTFLGDMDGKIYHYISSSACN